VADLESLTIDVDHRERIVINERTGTIIIGKDVRITPVAIMHGALSVEVRTTFDVSQPEPLSQARPSQHPKSTSRPKKRKRRNHPAKRATVEELHARCRRLDLRRAISSRSCKA